MPLIPSRKRTLGCILVTQQVPETGRVTEMEHRGQHKPTILNPSAVPIHIQNTSWNCCACVVVWLLFIPAKLGERIFFFPLKVSEALVQFLLFNNKWFWCHRMEGGRTSMLVWLWQQGALPTVTETGASKTAKNDFQVTPSQTNRLKVRPNNSETLQQNHFNYLLHCKSQYHWFPKCSLRFPLFSCFAVWVRQGFL